MKRAAKALFAAVLAAFSFVLPATAQQPGFPQNMPPNTVYGRSGISTGPGQAIPFSIIVQLLAAQPNTWPQVQSFIGGNSAAITGDSAQVVIQNSSTTQESIFNPVTGGSVYDGARSTVYIPPSSTVLSGNGFAAYIRNRSGTGGVNGGGVGFYDLVTCGVASSSCWGANYRIIDNEDGLTHAFTGITLSGLEIDYQVTSPATVVGGITQYILTTAVSSVGGGDACSIAPGGTGKWTFCFVSNDGASVTAGYIGASAKSGTSIASQPIQFAWFNSGAAEKFSNLFADAAGQLTWPGNINLNGPAATPTLVNFQLNGAAGWQVGVAASGHFSAIDVANSNAIIWDMVSAGNLAFTPRISAPSIQASTIYSAAGTPLPTCNSGTDSTSAVVSDATSATYAGAYTSGGAQKRRVLCVNGTGWITN